MTAIFPQTLFATPQHKLPPELAEQRAAALLIAALCAPERVVRGNPPIFDGVRP